jgi:hypothetical protein
MSKQSDAQKAAAAEAAKIAASPIVAGVTAPHVPVPPADGQAPVAVDPVPSPSPRAISEASARAALEDQSKADLKKLAQRANIDDSGSKEELVDRLTPHAAAGTISVGGPQSIGLPPSQNR